MRCLESCHNNRNWRILRADRSAGFMSPDDLEMGRDGVHCTPTSSNHSIPRQIPDGVAIGGDRHVGDGSSGTEIRSQCLKGMCKVLETRLSIFRLFRHRLRPRNPSGGRPLPWLTLRRTRLELKRGKAK